mmetsp:Transcript_12199/g.34312  ORF Transcript_12199/g.34312 Transcript_12199/m.34312 type:complete len:221 (+) Transcript_12199:117-779(+)
MSYPCSGRSTNRLMPLSPQQHSSGAPSERALHAAAKACLHVRPRAILCFLLVRLEDGKQRLPKGTDQQVDPGANDVLQAKCCGVDLLHAEGSGGDGRVSCHAADPQHGAVHSPQRPLRRHGARLPDILAEGYKGRQQGHHALPKGGRLELRHAVCVLLGGRGHEGGQRPYTQLDAAVPRADVPSHPEVPLGGHVCCLCSGRSGVPPCRTILLMRVARLLR